MGENISFESLINGAPRVSPVVPKNHTHLPRGVDGHLPVREFAEAWQTHG